MKLVNLHFACCETNTSVRYFTCRYFCFLGDTPLEMDVSDYKTILS